MVLALINRNSGVMSVMLVAFYVDFCRIFHFGRKQPFGREVEVILSSIRKTGLLLYADLSYPEISPENYTT